MTPAILPLSQSKVDERGVITKMNIKGSDPSLQKTEAAEILVEVQE